MTLPYTQDREINDRYVNTIIFYGDIPIFVRGVEGPNILFMKVGDSRAALEAVQSNHKELRDGPFVLGYVNGIGRQIADRVSDTLVSKIGSAYATRMPVRRSKQGITAENLQFKTDRTYETRFNKMCAHTGFRDMMMGKYPSYRQALESLNDKCEMTAFAPRLAVGLNDLDTYDLHYRGEKVGTAVEDDHWVLGKKFKYLKEYLLTQGVRTW